MTKKKIKGDSEPELKHWIQAVGLASTIVPEMQIDPSDPIEMMQRVVARVEELKDYKKELDKLRAWVAPRSGLTISQLGRRTRIRSIKCRNEGREQSARLAEETPWENHRLAATIRAEKESEDE